MNILDAIKARQSIRSFKNQDVSREIIEKILEISRFAPSGGNTQPWKIYVLNKKMMKKLESTVLNNLDNGLSETPNFNIYPQPMSEHLKNRVKECGKLMYGALEIGKDDVEGRLNQLKQNFSFFGAPVGMLVTVEKEVDLNGWGHVGHFIQNICLSSMEFGLGTCLQESWSMYPETVQKIVDFSDSEILWCGIALGYPNKDHVINNYRTPREDLENFTKFL
jgi:nitroreductase|tara:strand:- start:131 stop:793 length:663 start_codon:yes stop_codon:yes gene_type:complete